MKSLIATLVVGMALAVPATAQVSGQSESDAQSSASNNLVFGSDSKNTPSVGGWGGNNTAPCQAAIGAGVGQPGLGLGISVPITKEFCKTMVETEFLVKIISIKDPLKRKLAITRACMTKGTIQEALVQAGVCIIK